MHCAKKNSYLQLQCGSIKPETINRLVTKGIQCIQMGFYQFVTISSRRLKEHDPHDSLYPFNRLCSQQPSLSVENIDLTRRKCGYGRKALEQLKNDLSSYDTDIIMKAVSTIGDIAIDPEKAMEIIRERIPQKMAYLLDRKDSFLTERICGTFAKLAIIAGGKIALTKNPQILPRLQGILEEERHPGALMKLGKCLMYISSFVTTADELVDNGFIITILNIVARENDDVAVLLLATLKNLMYGNGNYIAMENGGFGIMIELLTRLDRNVNISALKCLMMMTSTPLGKQLALDSDLLPTITGMLGTSENPELDAAITSVLMFATIRTEAKFRASKIKTIVPRLIKVCRNSQLPSIQLFSFSTLLNLAVHFELRALLQKKYIPLISKIECATPIIYDVKEKLLQELTNPSIY